MTDQVCPICFSYPDEQGIVTHKPGCPNKPETVNEDNEPEYRYDHKTMGMTNAPDET